MGKETRHFPAAAPSGSGSDEFHLQFLQLAATAPGTLVNGRYRIERTIGKGGFGIVFAAADTLLGSPVALKFLDPRHTRDSRKFLRVQREINISRRITEPHVAKIFSLEQWHGLHFLVMELVAGRSLAELLRERGRFTWEEFRPLFLQVLDGVAALHRENIIHRDLKPSNILVDADGQAKILDFGLAKDLTDNERTSSVGEIVGSPYYMSPEQISGREPDLRSDVYQLGLVLYKTLSGAHPFENSTTMELMVKHLNERPPPIERQAGLPRHVRFAIDRALEKRPERRFHDVAGLQRLVRRGRVPALQVLGLAAARSPWRWALAGALALLALGGGWRLTLGSPALASVRADGSVVSGRNPFGRTLWRRDFAPFTVLQAHVTSNARDRILDLPGGGRQVRAGRGDRYVWAILTNPDSLALASRTSIGGDDHDNRWIVLGESGQTVGNIPLSTMAGRNHDFANVYRVDDVQFVDRGFARENEVWFDILQAHGFYPSAFVFLQGIAPHVFSNPGHFHGVRRLPDGPGRARFLLQGTNNLVGHLFFIAEISFDTRKSGDTIHAVPNLILNPFQNLTGYYIFLPHTAQETMNAWADKGLAEFTDNQTGAKITVSRAGEIIVRNGSAFRRYKDDALLLARVYAAINASYQERLLSANPDRALAIMREANREPVANPFLKSALLCLQGALEVETTDFAAARRSLDASLALYPAQRDAPQKLCEIEFLRGDPAGASRLLAARFEKSASFWGLGEAGNLLFKSYCSLQSGDTAHAEELLLRIARARADSGNETMSGLLDLFRGEYDSACARFLRNDAANAQIFELPEYRLLLGRALLLAGRDPERADFYFRDLMQFSGNRGHLASMSHACLLARAGRVQEAGRFAVSVMAALEKKARGDFFTRLWLFYDAFLYGEVMSLAGDLPEARRGYELCIEANPYTALAAEARKRLAATPRHP